MHTILNHLRDFGKRSAAMFREAGDFLGNKDIFVALVIILVAFGSFGLGRLSKLEENRELIIIEDINENSGAVAPKNTEEGTAVQTNLPAAAYAVQAGKKFVASKNGTKYYLSWCSGVSRISEANKVWFATKEEAEGRGLAPAANCPGI